MKFFDKLFKAIGFDEREFEQEEENLGEGKNLKQKRFMLDVHMVFYLVQLLKEFKIQH